MAGSTEEQVQDGQIAHLVQEIDQAGRSGDAATLQELLGRARDRLAFYQGFDRVIADNVRRSGELMLESLSLKEQIAAEHGQVGARERASLLAQVTSLQEQFDSVSAQLASAVSALASLRATLDPHAPPTSDRGAASQGAEPVDDVADAPAGQDSNVAPVEGAPVFHDTAMDTSEAVTAEPVVLPAGVATVLTDGIEAAPTESEPDEDDPSPDAEGWAESRVIEIIAHDVAKAATALALQKHLRALPQVEQVDTREFASGVLRLQVIATAPISEASVLAWDGGSSLDVAVLQEQVIELRFRA